MKRNYIVVAIIVLLVIGAIVFTKNSSNNNTSNVESLTHSTIDKLLAEGKSVKCTYDNTDDTGVRNQGTAYFAGGKMFGDFTATQTDGNVYQSNVLKVNNTQYVWDKEKKEGYKVDTTAITDSSETNNDSFKNNKEYDFNCSDWSVDESMFAVPSDVNFFDNTDLIQKARDFKLPDTACDSLEGEAKTTCQKALQTQ